MMAQCNPGRGHVSIDEHVEEKGDRMTTIKLNWGRNTASRPLVSQTVPRGQLGEARDREAAPSSIKTSRAGSNILAVASNAVAGMRALLLRRVPAL